MNNKNVLDQYIEKERISYDSKVSEIGAEAMRKYGSRYQKWTKRATFHWEALTEDGVEIKESLLEPYPIAFKEFHAAQTMMKYQIRGYNALRELRRTALLCPELLDQGTKYDVLELSSGSCANYEVLTKYTITSNCPIIWRGAVPVMSRSTNGWTLISLILMAVFYPLIWPIKAMITFCATKRWMHMPNQATGWIVFCRWSALRAKKLSWCSIRMAIVNLRPLKILWPRLRKNIKAPNRPFAPIAICRQ